jgi:membrane fusion protein, multidrug efflux system
MDDGGRPPEAADEARVTVRSREPAAEAPMRRREDRETPPPAGDDKPEDKAPKPPMSRGRRLLYIGLGLVVAAALIAGGVLYWLHARHFQSTDDAFIDGYRSQIAPQVGGRIINIAIEDNQRVETGQTLLRIDPRDYAVRLEQSRAQAASAAAQLEQARADLGVQRAILQQQEAQVRVAEAELQQAQQDLARYRGINPAAITRQVLDQSAATTRSAGARLDAAKQAVVGARAQIDSQAARVTAAEAALRQAEADVRNAELQLSYTEIKAPQPGRVTRRTVNLGDYVNPGQALLAVVPDVMWVTANFKENQLQLMRVGQQVEVTVDAFPDRPLAAHIESFQRGTGAVFSALPAENATGNYVKVVQRIPVKIVFDGDDWRRLPLAPGLSVVPRVTVR